MTIPPLPPRNPVSLLFLVVAVVSFLLAAFDASLPVKAEDVGLAFFAGAFIV